MNQKSVELLSSEELENVTGGKVTDVLKGVGNGVLETACAPVFNCIPKGKCWGYGRFDTNNISKSITEAVASTAAAGCVLYTAYKLVSGFCSKSEEEQVEATPAA